MKVGGGHEKVEWHGVLDLWLARWLTVYMGDWAIFGQQWGFTLNIMVD